MFYSLMGIRKIENTKVNKVSKGQHNNTDKDFCCLVASKTRLPLPDPISKYPYIEERANFSSYSHYKFILYNLAT